MLSSLVSGSFSEHFREAAIRPVFNTNGSKKRIICALHITGFISKNLASTSSFHVVEDMGLYHKKIGAPDDLYLVILPRLGLSVQQNRTVPAIYLQTF